MDISETQTRNGVEVDSYFGEININRGRYTLRFNKQTEVFEIVKVMFAHYNEFNRLVKEESETLVTGTDFKGMVTDYNFYSGEHDIAVP